jgi:hypothetical protein
MAQSRSIPSAVYPVGVREFELNQLPGSSEGAKFTFTRESWPEGDVARIDVYMMRNAVWQHVMGGNLTGGTIIGRDGNPLTVSTMSFTWPGENDGAGGRTKLRGSDVKVTANVLQSFRTAISIESL